MTRSMGLVALLVVGSLAAIRHPAPNPVRPVDYKSAGLTAAHTLPFPVVSPGLAGAGSLGAGWIATSARTEAAPDGSAIWRVGFVTPAGSYVALLERTANANPDGSAVVETSLNRWVADQTRDGQVAGTELIAGNRWTRAAGRPEPDERRSYLLTVPWRGQGVVLVVTGPASWEELHTFTASLATAGGRPLAEAGAWETVPQAGTGG
jgi:hypothetical protein